MIDEYNPKTKTLTCWVTVDEFWSMMETRAPQPIEEHDEAWKAVHRRLKEVFTEHGPIKLVLATVHMGANAMARAIPAESPHP
jgi:hypothetical protein